MNGIEFATNHVPVNPEDGHEVRWFEFDAGAHGDPDDAVYVYEFKAVYRVLLRHAEATVPSAVWIVLQPTGLSPRAAVAAGIGVNGGSPIRVSIPAERGPAGWNPWPGIRWDRIHLTQEAAIVEAEGYIDQVIAQKLADVEKMRNARLALRAEAGLVGERWPPVSP